MKAIKFIKLTALAAALVFSLAACSTAKPGSDEPLANEEKQSGISSVTDKHLNPDLSKTEVPKASEAVSETDTIENFVKALEAFANPNGNEYDALSILGEFRYDEKGDALLKRLKTASKAWHEPIAENVGEKCLVTVKLDEVKNYDLTDSTVTEWNTVNGLEAEDYAKISCSILTNYARRSIVYTFDIVKLDGKWYLSTIGTIDKIQTIITTDIYR